MAEAEVKQTPVEARDDFLKYIGTLPEEQQLLIFSTADKLLTLVTKPHMLNAFVLANAELAVLHYEGNLTAPKIARVGLPDSFIDLSEVKKT